MMEFTMTRVVMVVCGMLVLAAVIPSVNSLYESEESIELQEQTECVCRMIDAFSDSETDEMVLFLSTILPPDCSVSMEGYFVTISDGDDSYRYDTGCILISDKDNYDRNDCIRLTKDDGAVIIETL